jgi:hypothetical protein
MGTRLKIARYAVKRDVMIVGGFQRLLQHAKGELQQFDVILTYADLRFGDGKIYERAGFEDHGQTEPDYFYTDYDRRYNRFGFRATSTLSEAQIAAESGVVRIYGVGSKIYLLPLH